MWEGSWTGNSTFRGGGIRFRESESEREREMKTARQRARGGFEVGWGGEGESGYLHRPLDLLAGGLESRPEGQVPRVRSLV